MTKVSVTPVAQAIPFDNTTGGFTATDVQAAIIEAKSDAVNLPRYSIVTTFNGSVSNNQWLGYGNLLPGDQVPILIPVRSRLKELTFSSAGDGTVDGRLDLYKNGLLVGDIFYQGSFVNENKKTFSNIDQLFEAGDTLVGRWVDQGDNPSDAAIVYFFQVEET